MTFIIIADRKNDHFYYLLYSTIFLSGGNPRFANSACKLWSQYTGEFSALYFHLYTIISLYRWFSSFAFFTCIPWPLCTGDFLVLLLSPVCSDLFVQVDFPFCVFHPYAGPAPYGEFPICNFHRIKFSINIFSGAQIL